MPDIPIIFEDDAVVVINKPAGLVVHPDGKTEEPSVSEWMVDHYPQARGVGEPMVLSDGRKIDRHGVVHRLDRETSGVLVLAKTQEAFEHLKKQFQERATEKTYRAFVYGEMKEREGVIDAPIGRSASDFRKWSAERGARGTQRAARTDFTVLKTTNTFSYIETRPKTGRTHQIRVHLKSIQHPVVCDTRYAPKRECALGFTRLALHAHTLAFTSPSGERMLAEAPLPEDFKRALVSFGE